MTPNKPQPSFTTPPVFSLALASLLPSPAPRILFVMALKGHDPTEVVTAWSYLAKEEYWEVHFATETGEAAKPDPKMMEKSLFRTVLGAKNPVVEGWYEMAGSKEFLDMRRFGGAEEGRVNFADYDAVYLPGGHDKEMIPYFLSSDLHTALRNYLPTCARKTGPIKASGQPLSTDQPKPQRVMAAICHGVLPLAFSKYPTDYPDPAHAGKSIIHNLETSTLPQWLEKVSWGASQLWGMGEYYRTFSDGVPGDSQDGDKGQLQYTDELVKGALDDPEKQFKRGPLSTNPFIHTDPNYHYVSARCPFDVKDLAMGISREIRHARQRVVEELAGGEYGGV